MILQLEADIRRLNEDIKRESEQIRQNLGVKGWIFYLGDSLSLSKKVLEFMEKEIGIPPDYSEGLLSNIQKKGVCICSRPLIKNTEEWEAIEDLRKRCLSAKLNNDLYRLMGKLDESSKTSYYVQRNDYMTSLARSSKRYYELQELACDNEKKIELARKEYDETADIKAKERLRQRDEIRKKKELLNGEIEAIRVDLENIKNIIERIEQQLSKTRIHDEGLELLSESKRVARDDRKSLIHSVKKLKRFLWKLKAAVSEVYNEIVTDGSIADIDQESLLPEILKSEIRGLQQGGGQAQVLVIAYIIALAKLRKDINNELKNYISIGVRELEDQCFFMDSGFAPMEDAYRGPTADSLPGKMKQLVLLLSKEQWDGAVADKLSKRIDGLYILYYYTAKNEELENNRIELIKALLAYRLQQKRIKCPIQL